MKPGEQLLSQLTSMWHDEIDKEQPSEYLRKGFYLPAQCMYCVRVSLYILKDQRIELVKSYTESKLRFCGNRQLAGSKHEISSKACNHIVIYLFNKLLIDLRRVFVVIEFIGQF
jgi:hypothetical protein